MNETRLTSGWLVRARPQGSPNPVTRLNTPGGNPASSTRRANSRTGAGACSEDLITTVLPAARAGAALVPVRSISAFHGTTPATTPMGSRSVYTCRSGLSIGRVAPWILSANPP